MTRPNRSLLALLVVAALGMGACDYFRPAEPEPPSTGSSFVPDYGSPDSTLSTIAKAIADKGRTIGATAYAGAFAESLSGSVAGYHQLFWPQDVADWSQASGRLPPPDWGFSLELTFYTRFFRQQYKRSCVPDGPKVGTVSLSPRGDWRMPSDADPGEWLRWASGPNKSG